MGISNDIKPRKVYHPGKHEPKKGDYDDSEVKISHHKSADDDYDELDQEIKESYTSEREQLEDDFFKGIPKKHPHQREEVDENAHHEIKVGRAKTILWIFTIILIAIIVFQNYKSIKSLVWPEKNQTDSQSEEPAETYNSVSDTTTQAPATTTTPSATTAPTAIDKTKITISVLNGNGYSGSAAKIVEILNTAGFSVAKATNAKSFNNAQSYIYYKTGKEKEAAAVSEALTGKTFVSELSDSLAGKYDIAVVVGKDNK